MTTLELRVLVVDDSLTARQQVGRALTQAGFVVVNAADGQEALEQLDVCGDVSLVVCDINMPRMNGLDFLAELRKLPAHASLPVIVLTTEGHPELVQQAKRLGARGWIVKPFKPEMLAAAARKVTATS